MPGIAIISICSAASDALPMQAASREGLLAGGKGQPQGEVMAILQPSPLDVVVCMSEPEQLSFWDGTSHMVMPLPQLLLSTVDAHDNAWTTLPP